MWAKSLLFQRLHKESLPVQSIPSYQAPRRRPHKVMAKGRSWLNVSLNTLHYLCMCLDQNSKVKIWLTNLLFIISYISISWSTKFLKGNFLLSTFAKPHFLKRSANSRIFLGYIRERGEERERWKPLKYGTNRVKWYVGISESCTQHNYFWNIEYWKTTTRKKKQLTIVFKVIKKNCRGGRYQTETLTLLTQPSTNLQQTTWLSTSQPGFNSTTCIDI